MLRREGESERLFLAMETFLTGLLEGSELAIQRIEVHRAQRLWALLPGSAAMPAFGACMMCKSC